MGGTLDASNHHAAPAIRSKSGPRSRDRRLRSASDDTLLTLARQRQVGAFDELYVRHHREAVRYARALAFRHLGGGSADDLVAEAMRKVLSAIANGRGPRSGFRPYLVATLRSVVFRESSKARDEWAKANDERRVEPAADDRLETRLATAALSTLSAQSQRILWLTEALQLPAAETAVHLGMEPATVRVAAMRAREALRVAYVEQFLPSPRDQSCRRTLNHLVRRAVTNISPRQSTSVDDHLARCASCGDAATLIDEELAHWPHQREESTPTSGASGGQQE